MWRVDGMAMHPNGKSTFLTFLLRPSLVSAPQAILMETHEGSSRSAVHTALGLRLG